MSRLAFSTYLFLSSPVSSILWLQIYWLIMKGKSWEIKTNYLDHLEYVLGAFCLKQPFLNSSLLRWIMEGEGCLSLKHHFCGTCSKEMAENCVMKWRQYLNCLQELLSLGAAMLPGSPWPSRMIQSMRQTSPFQIQWLGKGGRFWNNSKQLGTSLSPLSEQVTETPTYQSPGKPLSFDLHKCWTSITFIHLKSRALSRLLRASS